MASRRSRGLFAALLASAIAAVFDPLDCCFNLVEDVFVASEQGKREFLIGIVAPKLFHVGRYALVLLWSFKESSSI